MSCPPVSIGQLLSEDEIAVPSCISGKGMQSSLGTKVNMHSDTYIAKWIINDYRKWRTSVSRHTTLSTCLHSLSYSIWSPYIMYFKRYDKCTHIIIWKQLSRTSDKHKDKTIWMLISWGWILKDWTTDFNNFHRFCPLQAERTASVQSCFCPDWLHHSEVYWIPALRSVKYGSPIHLIVFLIKKTNTILINSLWLNIRLSIQLII